MEQLTIQEVAERTGLSAHTLRYYERVGLLSDVNRASNGHRRYSEDDMYWLDWIVCLRATQMPLSEIQRYYELALEGDDTVPERKQILLNHRREIEAQIEQLHQVLGKIDFKLTCYEEHEQQQQELVAVSR